MIDGLPDEIAVEGCIEQLGQKLVTTNVESAITWAQQLPVKFRSGVQTAIAEQLAADDFARASAYAVKAAEETGTGRAISSIARFMAAKPPEESVKWIQSVPVKWQRTIAHDVMNAWLATDPQKATQIALGLPKGGPRDEAIATVAYHLYSNDRNYPAAMEMIKQIGDAKLRGLVSRGMPMDAVTGQ